MIQRLEKMLSSKAQVVIYNKRILWISLQEHVSICQKITITNALITEIYVSYILPHNPELSQFGTMLALSPATRKHGAEQKIFYCARNRGGRCQMPQLHRSIMRKI